MSKRASFGPEVSPHGKGSSLVSATSFPAPSQTALGRHRKLPSCGKTEQHRDPHRLLVAWRAADGPRPAVLIKRFFCWCVEQEIYGLSASPCEGLSGKKLIGELQSRDRRLSDIELFAFWRATGRMGYPGSVYRTLLLTGLRLNEAAQISWPEVRGNAITIPASRMKGREGKAREHLVPMSAALREVIASVPRIKNGPFLFSMSAGKRPLAMTGPIKADLDKRMLRTLKALARRRGEDHRAVDLPGWVNHDLRRVVRSGLSALRIPHNVAEAILAHRPPGIVGTYNLHEYEDEKAEALEKWAQRLNSIVSPPAKVPDKKIVPLRKRPR